MRFLLEREYRLAAEKRFGGGKEISQKGKRGWNVETGGGGRFSFVGETHKRTGKLAARESLARIGEKKERGKYQKDSAQTV